MNHLDRLVKKIFQSSLIWGGALTAAFYLLVNAGQTRFNPWLYDCLTGHWESYVCIALFCVGITSLTKRGVDLANQLIASSRLLFENLLETSASEGRQAAMLEQLEQNKQTPRLMLLRRLRNALQFLGRSGADRSFLDALRALSESDRKQVEQRYELARFVIGALPAVGSLSTVLGIAAAISQLGAANSADLVAGVAAGLAEAFDVFALALSLSLVLVVFKFATRQGDQRLLMTIDGRVEEELKTQINQATNATSDQIEQLRTLAQNVAKAAESLAARQAAPDWTATRASDVRSPRFSEADEQKMEQVVARAVANALHHQPVSAAPSGGPIDLAGWKPLQQALQQVASYLARQQAKQESEGEVVKQLIEIIDAGLQPEHVSPHRPHLRVHDGASASASA